MDAGDSAYDATGIGTVQQSRRIYRDVSVAPEPCRFDALGSCGSACVCFHTVEFVAERPDGSVEHIHSGGRGEESLFAAFAGG